MMDKLREDVRAVIDRQQEGLGDLAAPSRRVLRSALEKRDEPISRRTQLVAGIAAVVIAVLVVGTFAYVRAGNRTHMVVVPETSPTPIVEKSPPLAIGPNPFPGLHRWDIDMVDSATVWTLLTNCNSATTDPCNYFVAATTDGGQTWSKRVQVGPSYVPQNGDAPRRIHFVNAGDGFVYGGAGAFVTHDGGMTWTELDFRFVFVKGIVGRGKTVWAFTYPCSKGTLCPSEVRRSNDGGRTWSAPHSLPLNFSAFDIGLFGATGLFASSAEGQMVITYDGGNAWRSINTPCGANPFHAWVATSDGIELWELCMSFPKVAGVDGSPSSKPTSMPVQDSADKVLFVSLDGGLSWSRKGTTQAGGKLPVSGTQVSLASTQPHQLVVATNGTSIMLTTDGASSWTKLSASPSGVQWIRFTSPEMGWAMDVQGGIWNTTNGGATWSHLVSFDLAP